MAKNTQRKVSPVTVSIVILVGLFTAFAAAASVYTDFLWFDQLGFKGVFTTQIIAQVASFAVAALISGLVIWFTVWSSLVHALVMAVQSLQDPMHGGHLLGDVPALVLVAVVLGLLMKRQPA